MRWRWEERKITLLLFIPAHLDSFPKISTFKLGVKPQTFRWTLNTNEDTNLKKSVFVIPIREIHFDNENLLKLIKNTFFVGSTPVILQVKHNLVDYVLSVQETLNIFKDLLPEKDQMKAFA